MTLEEVRPADRSDRSDPAARWDALGRIRLRLAPLFASGEARPITRASVAFTVVAVVALAAFSISRVGPPGALNLAWGEDASNFLTDAYTQPAVDNILKPVNGYFLVVPRLFAECASLFPVRWGAGVLSGSTALFSAAMAALVYIASRNVLAHPFARLLAAAIMVAAPLAMTTSAAAVQFPMLYALFWCALWTPTSRIGRAVLVAFVAMCGVSSFLTVLFIPLTALRLWVRRDRLSAAVFGAFLFGAAVQLAGLVLGISSRGNISHPRWEPLWALSAYVTWGLPYGVMGQTGMPQPHLTPKNPFVYVGDGAGPWYWVGVALAWLLVLGVLAVAMFRWTSPRWLFAGVAALHAVGMVCLLVMVQGQLVVRYVFAPSLILASAMVALLLPRPDLPAARAITPLVALSLVLTALVIVNYRVDAIALPWDVKVAEARSFCADRPHATAHVRMGPIGPWAVDIPCRRLR